MDRLTIKNSDGSYSQPTHTTFEKMFYKCAEFEDFLEEQGFESLDECKQYYVNLIDLKDWVCDRIDGTESDNGIYTEFHSGLCNAYCKVLEKMQELEGKKE